MTAVVALEDLTVSYRRHPALHHISGSFTQGSMTALIGPNGAGKSTLLKSILGMVPIDSGRVAVCPPRFEIRRRWPGWRCRRRCRRRRRPNT